MDNTTPIAGTGTKEALKGLLDHYPISVQWGMHYAVKLARKNLTVHSREVMLALIADKIIPTEGKKHWIGAVFRTLRDLGILEKTGQFHKYSDELRNSHERTNPIWQLKPTVTDATLAPYMVTPVTKPVDL